jgi:hypothetical protein
MTLSRGSSGVFDGPQRLPPRFPDFSRQTRAEHHSGFLRQAVVIEKVSPSSAMRPPCTSVTL